MRWNGRNIKSINRRSVLEMADFEACDFTSPLVRLAPLSSHTRATSGALFGVEIRQGGEGE